MKVNKLFLSAAVILGLGFTGCSNDDDVPSGEKGNTNVSVTLKMSAGSQTKALPNDYNYIGEWAGKDDIKTVTVYLVDGSSVTSKSLEVGASGSGKDYEKIVSGSDITLVPKTVNAAIKTTAGSKKVYVLVNGTTQVVDALAKTPVAEFEDAYTQVALAMANSGTSTTVSTSADKLAVKNGTTDEKIVMTNVEPKTILVEANVTDTETLAATAPKNRVSLNVERAVARVMVSTEALPILCHLPEVLRWVPSQISTGYWRKVRIRCIFSVRPIMLRLISASSLRKQRMLLRLVASTTIRACSKTMWLPINLVVLPLLRWPIMLLIPLEK